MLGNRTISVAMSNPPARGGHHGNRPPPHAQGRSPVEVAMDTSKPQEAEPEATNTRYDIMVIMTIIYNNTHCFRTRKSRSAISLVPRSVARKPDDNKSTENIGESKPMSNDDFRKLLGK